MIHSSLPSGWTRCSLGDAVEYGVTERADQTSIPDNAWVLDLADIQPLTSRLLSRVTQFERRSRSTKSRFFAGDVLFGMLRPYLNKVIRATESGYCSTEIVPLRPSAVLDGDFLVYWLSGSEFRSYVSDACHGLNMPRLGAAAGRRAPLVLPPIDEQRRIAARLDALFQRVRACEDRLARVPSILDHFRQTVFAAAMSGSLTEKWCTSKGIHTSWERSEIQAVARVGTGSTPLRSNPAFYALTGTPWVTNSMTSCPVVSATTEFVTDEAVSAYRMVRYPPGTLLVAMYGDGKTRGQVTELGISATINQACAAVSVDETLALKDYVRLFLESKYFQMRALADGASQKNLNLRKIKRLPILLPPISEQAEIARRVSALLRRADHVRANHMGCLTYLDDISSALLAMAFCGELVLQERGDGISRPRELGMPTTKDRRALELEATGTTSDTRTDNTERMGIIPRRLNVEDRRLSVILNETGPLTAEVLWAASKLSIDNFYEQLKLEEERGLLRERRALSPTAHRLIEATS